MILTSLRGMTGILGLVLSLAAALTSAEQGGGVTVSCSIYKQGGNVSGCGLLARYQAPGPEWVDVERATLLNKDTGIPPIAFAKVMDPEGRTVAWHEFTDQAEPTARIRLAVPPGPAGVWRVSFQGGRANDRIAFKLPPAIAWGVRGEMALGQAGGASQTAWIWIPPNTTDMLIEVFGEDGVFLMDRTGKRYDGVPEGRRKVRRWSKLPVGTALRIEIPAGVGALAIDGVPGLLCPDEPSANSLRGGTFDVEGRCVAGPVQARARRWMIRNAQGDLDPRLRFPRSLPAVVEYPIAAAQLYGAYAPLSALRIACASQVLDPASGFFGSLGGVPDGTIHGSASSAFDALGLAAAITSASQLNPAFGNKALVTRAALLAFYQLSRLQGDDLIREGDIAGNGYPMTHAFFVFQGSLAGPLPPLLEKLDPEAYAIWRDGLIAVGDRLCDYRGSQTNQWWHVIQSTLSVYKATGEVRFLKWFERQIGDMVQRPPGSNSKFGQHPAGYFMEEYGPDGNYDAINTTCLVDSWRSYIALPQADPRVKALLEDSIRRNLAFASCHWLPQPDGLVVGPTSMVTRKVFSFSSQGWPGTRIARDAFPLAAAQWKLVKAPENGIGIADLMPHFINSDAWAMKTLEQQVPLGDEKFTTGQRGIGAAWTIPAFEVAKKAAATPALLPCQVREGTWELPGQIAWKRGSFYGLVFWGITGVTGTPQGCRVGGGPSALWSPDTGTILLSLHNTHFEDGNAVGKNGVAVLEDLTHACVYGQLGESIWWSGAERADLVWDRPGQSFRIAGKSKNAPSAPVEWIYEYDGDRVVISAAVTLAGLESPRLNLPFLFQDAKATLVAPAPGIAQFKAGGGVIDVTWAGQVLGEITPSLETGIPKVPTGPVRCLRIPMVASGDGWTQRVVFSVRQK